VTCDQVHERTVENDFLLLTLRDLIEREEDAKGGCKRDSPLHVCLMSATLDSNVLTQYFGKCPRVSMPGRTFPVTTLHLEDALYLTRHQVDSQADWCRTSMNGSKRIQRKLENLSEGEAAPPPHPTESEWMRRLPKADSATCRALAQLDIDAVNYDLISQLVGWYIRKGGLQGALHAIGAGGGSGTAEAGAVLIFLPGTREIDDLQKVINLCLLLCVPFGDV